MRFEDMKQRGKLQRDFVDFVLRPLWEPYAQLEPQMQPCLSNLIKNRNLYELRRIYGSDQLDEMPEAIVHFHVHSKIFVVFGSEKVENRWKFHEIPINFYRFRGFRAQNSLQDMDLLLPPLPSMSPPRLAPHHLQVRRRRPGEELG